MFREKLTTRPERAALADRINAAVERIDPASPAARDCWQRYAAILRKSKLTAADENDLVEICRQLGITAAMLDVHRAAVAAADELADADDEHEKSRMAVAALDAELVEARNQFFAARRAFGEAAQKIEARRGEAWSRQCTAWENRRQRDGIAATFPQLFACDPSTITAAERREAILPGHIRNLMRDAGIFQ